MLTKLYFIILNFYILNPVIFICIVMSLFIVLLQKLITFLRPNKDIAQKNALNNTFNFLDSYYVHNIYITCSLVFIYFFSTLGIFFIVRYLRIDNTIVFQDALLPKISYVIIVVLIEFFFIIYLYKKLLNIVLYKEVFKLHIYLRKYEYYEERCNPHSYLGSLLNTLSLNILLILKPNNESILRHYKTRLKTFEGTKLVIKYPTKVLIIHDLVSKSVILRKLMIYIDNVITNIITHREELEEKLPLFLLFLIVIYDLSYGQFKYIYISLFIYLIIRSIQNVIKFLKEKDPVYDSLLYSYFYEDNYEETYIKKEKNNPYKYRILDNREEISKYLLENYKVDSLRDPAMVKTLALINRHANEKYVRIGISIITLYIIGITTYNILIVIPLAIVYTTINRNKIISNIMFWLSAIVQTVICAVIYIKRKMIMYMDDTIWDYGIKITQRFTIEDKLEFVYKYIVYSIKYTKGFTLDQKVYFIDIITNIKYKDLITEVTSITQLRHYIDSLLPTYARLENAYIQSNINMYDDIIVNTSDAISDATMMIILTGTLATCIYILPPIFMFIDAYIQITNPKFHILLVLGKKTYRSFTLILKAHYPDYF